MKRREFLGVLTGAVAMEAFEQELKKFGWTIGQNVQIEVRWATGSNKRTLEVDRR